VIGALVDDRARSIVQLDVSRTLQLSPSSQRISRQAEAELAVVLVSGVAHHLMDTGGVEIAQ
jgi:hypothetical protein